MKRGAALSCRSDRSQLVQLYLAGFTYDHLLSAKRTMLRDAAPHGPPTAQRHRRPHKAQPAPHPPRQLENMKLSIAALVVLFAGTNVALAAVCPRTCTGPIKGDPPPSCGGCGGLRAREQAQ
ncbi:hypothetical protein PsYK624_091940 [Phanerochaete sordida]|uniref:Uncharacterized protein n=1 Tax=Phanerochaete sordida TaxID=48140 RepID=A0A9P3GDZ3_9APHY|nr:hypothetical protein PsYK624_091940 [Phanerochaete sordida]